VEYQKEQKENGAKEIFKTIVPENFPKLMTDTTSHTHVILRASRINTKILHVGISYSKFRIILKAREDNTLPTDEQDKELQQTSHQKLCKQEESGMKYLKCERTQIN
jgi:hypothetical protein